MAALKKSDFAPERPHATLTPAKSVRLAREFQQMTQHELAKASGVPQPAIAGIESARIALGSDRAEKLARALKVHPSVLMWPQWDEDGLKGAAVVRKSARTGASPARFALYWCTTADGDEDGFVVAPTESAARRFYEDEEGYDLGIARAERIMALPAELLTGTGWRNGPSGRTSAEAGWPRDELLVACGAEIAQQPRDDLREMTGSVCKDVRFGERVFRAGDVVTNVEREHGVKQARLSAFKGGRRHAVQHLSRGGRSPRRHASR